MLFTLDFIFIFDPNTGPQWTRIQLRHVTRIVTISHDIVTELAFRSRGGIVLCEKGSQ